MPTHDDSLLASFGWSDHFATAFAAAARAEAESASESAHDASAAPVPARVVAEHRNAYRVWTAAGERDARVAGRLRHRAASRAELPAVGDWVIARAARAASGGPLVIREVLPRRSRFARKSAGLRAEEQVVAANIDIVWVVAALDRPVGRRRIERSVALAWESGAAPEVVLTKRDACADPDAVREEAAAAAGGARVHVTSARLGDGLDALRAALAHNPTVALIGPSGAGKSTLINALAGEERLRTGDVREDDAKGRHTTTHRQLLRLPGGGLVVDTPGMRELALWQGDDGVETAFAEIGEIAASCRFADCRHATEPGCAVAAAVARGEVAPERLASFHKLQREIAHTVSRVDARARAEETRRARSIHKALRDHPKYRR